MATRQPRAARATTGRRTADQATPAQAAPQAAEQQATPAPATPLPATFQASTAKPGANAAASQAAFNTFNLPASLQAKGAVLCGGTLPAKLQPTAVPQGKVAVLVAGKPFVARSGHNAAWAATTLATIAAAQAAGRQGATPAEVLAAGVGGHSIAAYLKRGWIREQLVPAQA